MFNFFLVVHALIAAALVGVILMQRSEGGGFTGGSPGGLVSARGAADFLTRTTAILAGLFITLSIGMAALSATGRAPRKLDTSLDRSVKPTGTGLPGINTTPTPAAPTATLPGANVVQTPATTEAPMAAGPVRVPMASQEAPAVVNQPSDRVRNPREQQQPKPEIVTRKPRDIVLPSAPKPAANTPSLPKVELPKAQPPANTAAPAPKVGPPAPEPGAGEPVPE